MSKRMLAEAERIIESLNIGSYLYTQRDNHRRKLMEIWRGSENGKRFAQEAVVFVDLAVQREVSVQTYKSVSLSVSVDRARANLKISQFVLYSILEGSVVECVWNQDDWFEMRCIARAALFDPEMLSLETEYFVQCIPGLSEIIVAEFGDIERELREEYEFRNQGSIRDRLLYGVSVLGKKLLTREVLSESVARCIDELSVYAKKQGSAQALLSLYVVYYAFSKCPTVQDIKWAVDRFEGYILAEIGRCR